MARPLIECVPNFSEGRDPAAVQAIEQSIRSVSGVLLLRSEMDPDHNRSVITFAGPPDAVAEAALRGIAKAVELIDLRKHSGVHPRIGAADVVPFVPLENASMDDCVELAHRTGEAVWTKLGVPVYFYESAARHPDRKLLESCRRGGFEKPALEPDLGGPALHPSAGACIIGARKLLIAFNINLNTADVKAALAIARKVRMSSGGLPFVKAMGVRLASRNLVQVSTTLTDFERTPLHEVFAAVRREAELLGVAIAGSEIVGLVPKAAVELAAASSLACEGFRSELVLENQLNRLRPAGSLGLLLDDLARPRAPHAGGSAAAASAAMAAALASKLCGILHLPDQFRDTRQFLAEAVERDAEAFEATRKQGKIALADATEIPTRVAELAKGLSDWLATLAVPEPIESDRAAAHSLAQAGRAAAIAIARANLALMDECPAKSALETRLRAIE